MGYDGSRREKKDGDRSQDPPTCRHWARDEIDFIMVGTREPNSIGLTKDLKSNDSRSQLQPASSLL